MCIFVRDVFFRFSCIHYIVTCIYWDSICNYCPIICSLYYVPFFLINFQITSCGGQCFVFTWYIIPQSMHVSYHIFFKWFTGINQIFLSVHLNNAENDFWPEIMTCKEDRNRFIIITATTLLIWPDVGKISTTGKN